MENSSDRLIYEKSNGITYARKFGEIERTAIRTDSTHKIKNEMFTLWNEILLESEHNPALQKALDRAIMIYRLSKDNPK